jgi:hypothetical protein
MLHVNVIVFFFCSVSGNLTKWFIMRASWESARRSSCFASDRLTERGMRLVLEEFAPAIKLAE